MCFVIAGMIVGSLFAVPARIDAEPVSIWITTGGLVDDRPLQLAVDPRIFTMDDDLADGLGWPVEFDQDWSDIAADLASYRGEGASSVLTDGENVNEAGSAVEPETGTEIAP